MLCKKRILYGRGKLDTCYPCLRYRRLTVLKPYIKFVSLHRSCVSLPRFHLNCGILIEHIFPPFQHIWYWKRVITSDHGVGVEALLAALFQPEGAMVGRHWVGLCV